MTDNLRVSEQAAELAGSIASEINDELTVILSSLRCELPAPERMAAVEQASMRCARIARGLALFSRRYGCYPRPVPLSILIDSDLL